ncbi:MAG: DUF4160 domain-containing protein [Eubacterium sp.]|nr:DUF4160 domain-containing protein [Eubacterium sp.]
MPQIFKFGGYIIFFWSNENKPTEPIHVHIAKYNPKANSTKVWITKRGKALICNNNSRIVPKDLRKLLVFIEANSSEIMKRWYDYFGEIDYYC